MVTVFMATFGDYLRDVMRSRNISARQVAAFAELSPNTVSLWLRGAATPQPDTLRKLAKGLNVPFTDLMDAAGHTEGTPRPADGEGTLSVPPGKISALQEIATYSEDWLEFVRNWLRTVRELTYEESPAKQPRSRKPRRIAQPKDQGHMNEHGTP
jgi:transcriptional regulator with XRE-family HTH domain